MLCPRHELAICDGHDEAALGANERVQDEWQMSGRMRSAFKECVTVSGLSEGLTTEEFVQLLLYQPFQPGR